MKINSKFFSFLLSMLAFTASFAFFFHHKELKAPFRDFDVSLISLVLVLTASSMLYNVFYPSEKSSLKLGILAVLNAFVFVFMIISNSFLILLLSQSFISIIAFYEINNVIAKKRFMFFNMFADLVLFALFALIKSQTGSDSLDILQNPINDSDLISSLFLLCSFIKSSVFLFHTHLLDLCNVSFNRQTFLSYIGPPFAGILLLYKLAPLIDVSHATLFLINSFAILSMSFGFIGTYVINNIKLKAAYLNIILYGFSYALFVHDFEVFRSVFPKIFLLSFFLNVSIMQVIISSSNENCVSKMGGFIKKLKLSFALMLLIFFTLIQTLATFLENPWVLALIILYVLAFSHLFYEIYMGQNETDDKVWALLKNTGIFYFLPSFLICSYMVIQKSEFSAEVFYIFFSFVLLLFCGLFRGLECFYDDQGLQSRQIVPPLFDIIIVRPVKTFGRILWLTVDFLFIEKTLFAFFHKLMGFLKVFIGKINKDTKLNYAIAAALGIMLSYFILRGGILWK